MAIVVVRRVISLMAVLVVVGLMNLLWMASIFVLFFVEMHWKHGIVLTKIAGGALMALGAVVMARPAVLTHISQAFPHLSPFAGWRCDDPLAELLAIV